MSSERKNQIIAAAARLFSDRGYGSVTVKRIASACGITEAALYKHFDSKSSIYIEVLRELQQEIPVFDLFDTLESETDIENIFRSIAGFIIESYQKHQKILRLLLYSSLERHSLSEEIYESVRMPYINFLTSKLQSMIAEGKIRQVNPSVTARCFIGMVFDYSLNLSLWKGFAGQNFATDVTIENNIGIFVKGLKPGEAGA